MAKLEQQDTGSQYVPKRLGENTSAVTMADLNKLITALTASTVTLIEVTGPNSGEAIYDGTLSESAVVYDRAIINNNFATIRVEIDKIKIYWKVQVL